MSISLRGLHPIVRARAELCLSWSYAYGLSVTVTSAYRSWAEQTKLRSQFEECVRRGERIHPENSNPACRYPANQPGDSAHNYGFAFDSWVPEAEWWTWTYLRTRAGFRVPDHDRVHAEVPDWRLHRGASGLRRG